MSKRLPSLDGWRGISIFVVLVSHIAFSLDCPTALGGLAYRIFNGNLAVRVFFTISGFIITYLLLREKARTGAVSLRQFYVRRSIRILPVYAGYLGFILILQLLGRVHEAPSNWFGSLTFTRNLVGLVNSPTRHLWSLSIEEQFYLLWPITFKYFDFNRRRAVGISVAVIIVVFTLVIRTVPPITGGSLGARLIGEWSLSRYADCLTVGCVTAFLLNAGWSHVSGWVAALALAVFVLPELHLAGFSRPEIASFSVFAQAVTFAILMVYTIHSRGWAYRFLNWRPLVGLGVLSYSLYIWHFIFLDSFAPGALPYPILTAYYFWIVPAGVCAGLSWLILEAPARRPAARPSSGGGSVQKPV